MSSMNSVVRAHRHLSLSMGRSRREHPVSVPRRALVFAAVTVLAAGTALAAWATAQAASIKGDVYVAPGGSDGNPGTQSAPVKTLQKAQQLVRALNNNQTSDVTVVLEDGFYRLSTPLTLTAADSGTGGHSVVWTAD